MKTPRIFIMKITLRLGVAALLALLFTPSSSNALEGPYSNVKEIGPYLGDPDEPTGTIDPYAGFGGDQQSLESNPVTVDQHRTAREFSPLARFSNWFSRLFTISWRR